MVSLKLATSFKMTQFGIIVRPFPIEKVKMATSKEGQLSSRHITRLAANISLQNMKGLAQGYLDIDKNTRIKLLEENKGDPQAFNRDILEIWAENNPGRHQVDVGVILSFTFCQICITLIEKGSIFYSV